MSYGLSSKQLHLLCNLEAPMYSCPIGIFTQHSLCHAYSAGLAGLAITAALNLTGLMNWTVRQSTELEVQMNRCYTLSFCKHMRPPPPPHPPPPLLPASVWCSLLQHLIKRRNLCTSCLFAWELWLEQPYMQFRSASGLGLPPLRYVTALSKLLESPDKLSTRSVERILAYTNEYEAEKPAIVSHKRPPQDWPSKGQILFDNLVVKYRPELPPVLKGLSLKIEGGHKVCSLAAHTLHSLLH